jgi:hypothetical protein
MKLCIALLFACISTLAMAQPIAWSFAAKTDNYGRVELELTAINEAGWYIYATVLPSDDGPVPTSFQFQVSDNFALVDPLEEPEPIEQYDPNFGMVVRYHADTTRFAQRIKALTADAFVVEGQLEYMCCNDRTCLPPRVVPFRIPVNTGTPQNDR